MRKPLPEFRQINDEGSFLHDTWNLLKSRKEAQEQGKRRHSMPTIKLELRRDKQKYILQRLDDPEGN